MSVRVLIVEDEQKVRDEYKRIMREKGTIQLVAETDDVEEALLVLQTMDVDAMILELELLKGSGILLLEKIQTLDIEKPFIVVVTNVASKVIYDTIRNMGVDYICMKNDREFSLNVPLSIIEISAPHRKTREQAKMISGEINKKTLQNIYRRSIEDEMMKLGFSNKVLGTAYCRCAILYILLSENRDISMTKEVYPYVGSQFGVNAGNVERNIRIAIEKVWSEQKVEKLREHYPYEWNTISGRPTNAEFMYNVIKKIMK